MISSTQRTQWIVDLYIPKLIANVKYYIGGNNHVYFRYIKGNIWREKGH